MEDRNFASFNKVLGYYPILSQLIDSESKYYNTIAELSISKERQKFLSGTLSQEEKTFANNLLNSINLSKADLHNLDVDYTNLLSLYIQDFISKFNIDKIDSISSHGHTVLHQPQKKITYQIGNLPFLAKNLNINVVCDFRTQDVELGGQGAPLVPIGDQLLFPDYKYCLNLGGFANISYKSDKECPLK